MSNALAIASVTAVLKDILNNGVIDNQLSGVVGDVTVSALPPDRVLVERPPETSRLNLFLYQVTPNQGWRNVALPSRDASGSGSAIRRSAWTCTIWSPRTARVSSTPRSSSAMHSSFFTKRRS